MKGNNWIIALICILSGFLNGQVIDLGTPKKKNPDRVIPLKLLYALSGDSAIGYFFKNPSTPLFLSGDQSLLLSDQGQLLHFDQSGKFIKNLQKVGEGPGEWGDTRSIILNEAGLGLLSDEPNKCLIFDPVFKCVKEIRFDKELYMVRLIRANREGGSLFSTAVDFEKAKNGIRPYTISLKHFSPSGLVSDGALSFIQHVFVNVVKLEGGGTNIQMNFIDPFSYAYTPKKNRVLVNCSESYRLELADLNNERLVNTFTRPMKRQAWRKRMDEKKKPKKPDPDYFMDINALVCDGECFWVFTAEIDKQKGVRVDLIGSEGEYLDRFWLPLPGLDRPDAYGSYQIGLSKDRIAWIHKNDEDNPMVSVFAYDLKNK